MNIPTKYEDVVAKLDAALSREAALREELEHEKSNLRAFTHLAAVRLEMYETSQQRLTVAEQRESLLASFAKEIIEAAFEGGSLDGAEIQDIAVKHGLLKIESRTEECGEACACREFGFPSECYRKTDLSALKQASEAPGSTCNQIREESGLPTKNPCVACNNGACIDR